MLGLVRPFVFMLPDVKPPGRTVNFHEKLVWTSVALLIFLIASQVPLFGIMDSDTADPFYWMRVMMASNRGTLMDLGISPVITSSMIIQALTNIEFLSINNNIREDRLLNDALHKLLALILTLGQAVAQVFSGFYGSPKSLGPTFCCLLIFQLLLSGFTIILLDELLSKYGIGSGVNLFIATNTCESMFWKALSPKVFRTARGLEFEGCLVSLFYQLSTRSKKLAAFYDAFFRQGLPNLSKLLSTLVVIAVVVYAHGLRLELPLESTQTKGCIGRWHIKLLYAGTTPIIVQSYVTAHIATISKFLYKRFPKNLLVKMLGTWEMSEKHIMVAKQGLCKYMFPPESFSAGLKTPLTFLVYIIFTLVTSAILSKTWIDVSNKNAKSVADQIKKQGMTVRGVRDLHLEKYLDRYLPVAAALGGAVIGLISVMSNVFDTIGSGTNIILAVSIVWQYYEAYTKETMKRGNHVYTK